MARRKRGKISNQPNASGPPQERASSGSHPSHPSKKAKFNSHQAQQKKVDITSQGQVGTPAGPVNRQTKFDIIIPNKKIELSARQVYQKTNSTISSAPVHQVRAEVVPQARNKPNNVNAAGFVRQAKVESNRGHQNVALYNATTSSKQGKPRYTTATSSGMQVKGQSTITQAHKKGNLATHGKQEKPASTIDHKNTKLTSTASYSGQAKVEVITHKNSELIARTKVNPNTVSPTSKQANVGTTHGKKNGNVSGKKFDVGFSKLVEASSNDKINTSAFSKGNPRSENASTQRPRRAEELESSSSDSDEDSDDESEVALLIPKLPTTQPLKAVEIANSSSEDGSDSEDGEGKIDAESDEGSNVKAQVKGVPTENAKVDEGYDSTSESGHISTRTETARERIARQKIPKWFSPKVTKILESPNCPVAVPYKVLHPHLSYPVPANNPRPLNDSPTTVPGSNNSVTDDGDDILSPATNDTS